MEVSLNIKIDMDKKLELMGIASEKGLLISNYVRMILYEAIEREKNKHVA